MKATDITKFSSLLEKVRPLFDEEGFHISAINVEEPKNTCFFGLVGALEIYTLTFFKSVKPSPKSEQGAQNA